MDGIQSWSSFEQQQRNDPGGVPSSTGAAATRVGGGGIDALRVSASSPHVAPAAASLLRHSGLTAPSGSGGSRRSSGRVAADEDAGRGDEEEGEEEEGEEGEGEFRLRFHWMRPHPSLVFALEGEPEEDVAPSAAEGGAEADASDAATSDDEGNDRRRGGRRVHPAVESSRLVDAYRSSQMKKWDVANGEANDSNGDDSKRSNGESLNDSEAEQRNPDKAYADHDLPLELPKLRVNLASLVEPPLMSSWLPGEEWSDSDDEEDDSDE